MNTHTRTLPVAKLIDVQDHEIGAADQDALTRMATLGSEAAIAASFTLEAMSRWYGRSKLESAQQKSKTLKDAAFILRGEAGRGREIVQKIEDSVAVHIIPDEE